TSRRYAISAVSFMHATGAIVADAKLQVRGATVRIRKINSVMTSRKAPYGPPAAATMTSSPPKVAHTTNGQLPSLSAEAAECSPVNQNKYYPVLEQTRTHNDLYYVGPREKEQFIAYLNGRLRDKRLDGLVKNLFRPSYGGNRNYTLWSRRRRSSVP